MPEPLSFQVWCRPFVKPAPQAVPGRVVPADGYRDRQYNALAHTLPVLPAILKGGLPGNSVDRKLAPSVWFEGEPAIYPAGVTLRLFADFYFNKRCLADYSNLVGGLCDVFNGSIWQDDIQIIGAGIGTIYEHCGYNLIEFTVVPTARPNPPMRTVPEQFRS